MRITATARWVPRHIWVVVTVGRGIKPGHHWMYHGIVRRDTATIRGVGFVMTRMPAEQSLEVYRTRTGWTPPDPSR